MTGDTILLIGIDNKKVNLNEVKEYTKRYELTDTYGEDSVFFKPFCILQDEFEVDSVSILNLDSWDDLKDEEELFRQHFFTYIIPLNLRLADSYDNIFEQKRYLYSQLLVWMTGREPSTIVMTGVHASSFNTLTEYLAYEKEQINATDGYLYNLQKNNLIYVSNGLKQYDNAAVILTGILLNDISDYPLPDFLGEAYWDMDYCDVNMDLVWFRNNHLRETTIENLKNFTDDLLIKSVMVDRIIKWLKRNWPDMSDYIGTAFSDYKLVAIVEKTETYLKSLVNWIIYDYNIVSVSTEQYTDSSIGIHIRYEIWPKFTTEKYVDEVIL